MSMKTVYQPGAIIQDQYQITKVLGKGGVAITYQAINLQTESLVAIKVISLKQLDDWKQIELFQREAEVVAQLEHHAIPRYIDYFDLETETDKTFYIVQQQAPGKSLAELVESGWRSNEADVKQIAKQVLEILTYLHALDPPVIHRDIKPNNLILSDDGKIYLVDFGAVQNTYYNTLMQGSTVVGTYGYMAPEQFRGKALPTTDLYSLGATLLYLLTHRSPAELPQDTLKLNFRNSVDISENFADWLDKILEPDIDDRFVSAAIALNELTADKHKRPKETITRFCIAIFLLGLALGVNSHKWLLLSRLGFYPANVCSSKVVQNFFNQGGYINGINLKAKINLLSTIIKSETTTSTIDKFKITNNLSKVVNYKSTCQSYKDKTLLHLAIENGNLAVSKELFKYGADPNISYGYILPVIFDASLRGDRKIIELLVHNKVDLNARDNLGNTPLFNIVLKEHQELIELLVNSGADINATNKIGETPLFTAISTGNINLVEALLINRAKTDLRNNKGETPLSNAVFNKQNEIAQLLLRYGAAPTTINKSDLFKAVEKSNINQVIQLVLHGSDVNVQDDELKTPLFYASIRGNRDIVKVLINNGAKINAQDASGQTPLFHAASKGFVDVVELLIENGAKVNIKDKHGRDALSIAIINCDRNIVKLLIDNNADKHYLNYKNLEEILTEQTFYKRQAIKKFLDKINLESYDK